MTSGNQRLSGLIDEARHWIIRAVPRTNIVEPIPDVDILAVRTRGQISPPENTVRKTDRSPIQPRNLFYSELIEERDVHPTLYRFERARRVVSNKMAYQSGEPQRAQESCAVNRMKSCSVVCISNIMQYCGGGQIGADAWWDQTRKLDRLPPDRTRVNRTPVRQPSQEVEKQVNKVVVHL